MFSYFYMIKRKSISFLFVYESQLWGLLLRSDLNNKIVNNNTNLLKIIIKQFSFLEVQFFSNKPAIGENFEVLTDSELQVFEKTSHSQICIIEIMRKKQILRHVSFIFRYSICNPYNKFQPNRIYSNIFLSKSAHN